MAVGIGHGVVIFTGNVAKLARFYQGVAGLAVRLQAAEWAVLGSDSFELVIHAIQGEDATEVQGGAREDAYIKPFFPVPSLAAARDRAEELGGSLRPSEAEWSARGFRACEGLDPDGNVIQFREPPGAFVD